MRASRRILIGGLLVMAIVSLTVAVTVAYLSDQKQVTNTFTIGDVEIELLPKPPAANTPIAGGELQLNETAQLQPHVANIGPNDCFVKVEVTISDTDLLPYITLTQQSSDWDSIATTDFYTTGQATLYYIKVLPKALDGSPTTTANIFDSILLKDSYLEKISSNLEIGIKATAIQTQYNGSQATSPQDAFTKFAQ